MITFYECQGGLQLREICPVCQFYRNIYPQLFYKNDAVCLSVGDNITELKRLSSNPRIITCKPSCFQAATTSQEILYLGETTRIISFPSTTSTLEMVHIASFDEFCYFLLSSAGLICLAVDLTNKQTINFKLMFSVQCIFG